MAKLDTNLFFMPARKLAERIQAGKLTSVDLTAGYLDRLERFGPRLNAVVTVMREAAMAEARAADKEIKAGSRAARSTAFRMASRICSRPRASPPPGVRRPIATRSSRRTPRSSTGCATRAPS